MSRHQGDQVHRVGNPFHSALATELIDNPRLYANIFSEEILIGEMLEVFYPNNAVVVGPQGAGKSMILNLIRVSVLSEWTTRYGLRPPLSHISPFLGISINLQRVAFQAFGRRSMSRALGLADVDLDIELACAGDFLNSYLFREFLKALEFLAHKKGRRLARWMTLGMLDLDAIARSIAIWQEWFGYYEACTDFAALVARCDTRLHAWNRFLSLNGDIPEDIWLSKSAPGAPLHAMGNLLGSLAKQRGKLPLFVVIDQYEQLPELNQRYGTSLQRVVNDFIKARDPVVFYKIGARTYDWGRELRVWGSDVRIEVQRDYVLIDLADLLMRDESSGGRWLFRKLASDVAYKRIAAVGRYRLGEQTIEKLLGAWSAEAEAKEYLPDSQTVASAARRAGLLRGLPFHLQMVLWDQLGTSGLLDVRLAGAWALQQLGRGKSIEEVEAQVSRRVWETNQWWRKERVYLALLQIASALNQRKLYYGWDTVLHLSGANVSIFLLICEEIWDAAARRFDNPWADLSPIPDHVQTEGIFNAAQKWSDRDKNETTGGSRRFEFLSRLGPAIHRDLVGDFALSNPGHSGFSLMEAELARDSEHSLRVARFLQDGVSWAIFEDRRHKSKRVNEPSSRRKWFLHPLFSPVFQIPYARTKEPLYLTLEEVYEWVFNAAPITFRSKRSRARRARDRSQLSLIQGPR